MSFLYHYYCHYFVIIMIMMKIKMIMIMIIIIMITTRTKTTMIVLIIIIMVMINMITNTTTTASTITLIIQCYYHYYHHYHSSLTWDQVYRQQTHIIYNNQSMINHLSTADITINQGSISSCTSSLRPTQQENSIKSNSQIENKMDQLIGMFSKE